MKASQTEYSVVITSETGIEEVQETADHFGWPPELTSLVICLIKARTAHVCGPRTTPELIDMAADHLSSGIKINGEVYEVALVSISGNEECFVLAPRDGVAVLPSIMRN